MAIQAFTNNCDKRNSMYRILKNMPFKNLVITNLIPDIKLRDESKEYKIGETPYSILHLSLRHSFQRYTRGGKYVLCVYKFIFMWSSCLIYFDFSWRVANKIMFAAYLELLFLKRLTFLRVKIFTSIISGWKPVFLSLLFFLPPIFRYEKKGRINSLSYIYRQKITKLFGWKKKNCIPFC